MKSKIIIWLFFFLSLIFTGCQQQPEQEAPIEKSPAKQSVSFQLQWFTQSQFAGYYVALEKGWYLDEDIELTIYPGGPDVVPIDLVSAGTKDFGTTLLADLAVSIQKGKPAISLAQIQQNNGLRLLAKKSSNIKEPKDFINKKIGIWLGGWEVQFNALLAKKGISTNQINVISQGFSMTPFIEDHLDVASAMIYNEYHMVLASGIKKDELIIIDYADYELDFPGDVFFTSLKMYKENPDLCLRMLRASLKGWQYALKNPEEAVNIVLKYDKSGVQTKEHQLKMMNEISKLVKSPNVRIGSTDPNAIQNMINLLVKYKVIETKVELDEIYTDQLLNKI
ncbi:MAG: ABC transporter substrate-binding protein [Desulfobacteraceae bacterium]|nr:ABC transporter substrate-binding protein [Desulfobacteraceae bacterium]